MMRRGQWLRVVLLACCASLSCTLEGKTQENDHIPKTSGEVDLDNSHLPVDNKIAIMLSGQTRAMTPSAIGTLKRHVLDRHPNAHVFVHSSPLSHSEEAMHGLKEMYKQAIGEQLKAVIITPASYGKASSFFCHYASPEEDLFDEPGSSTVALQFLRLSELMPLLLREERYQEARYSHVVRMRTDITWLRDWPDLSLLHTLIPPDSKILATDLQGGAMVFDGFWIAGRTSQQSAL
jgi:hypothetical protein